MESPKFGNNQNAQEGGILKKIGHKAGRLQRAVFMATALSGAAISGTPSAESYPVEATGTTDAVHSSESMWSQEKFEKMQEWLKDVNAQNPEMGIEAAVDEYIGSYGLWKDSPQYTVEDLKAIQSDVQKVLQVLSTLHQRFGDRFSKYENYKHLLTEASLELGQKIEQKVKPRFASPEEEIEAIKKALDAEGIPYK